MGMFGPHRLCPRCGTANHSYMLVCTRCGTSLRGVPVAGAPGPAARSRLSSAGPWLGLLLAMAAVIGIGLLAARRLGWPGPEGRAAAAGTDREPAPAAEWRTFEQRWEGLVGPGGLPATPAPPPATAPLPPATPRPAPRPLRVPSSAPAAPPAAAPAVVATPSVAGEPAPGATAEPSTQPNGDGLRAERRTALRRAERRLALLERRARQIRNHLRPGVTTRPGEREELLAELEEVLRQIEDADREVIRAEWAARELDH